MKAGSILAFTAYVVIPVITYAEDEYLFNINSLNLTSEQKRNLDLPLLGNVNSQLPGEYNVTIFVNEKKVSKEKILFIKCGDIICPRLPHEIIKKTGIKESVFPGGKYPDYLEDDISNIIEGARFDFDSHLFIINLYIPQIALDAQARDYIPPQLWDDGINALFSSYSLSGMEDRRHNINNGSTQYLNLRNGINYYGWRLRNNSYYSRQENVDTWRSLQNWIETDIRDLNSQITAGEYVTPGMLFDSFNFKGFSVSTQDDMLPTSMQGYAPTITGIAYSRAVVEIRQNGNLIYQTVVSPGEFSINDLYSVTSSGEFEITLKEADGTIRTWSQYIASPPISIRQGQFKYSLTAGELDAATAAKKKFSQLELLYGITGNSSVYGGAIINENYLSSITGVGLGLGVFGAISFDGTYSSAELKNEKNTSGFQGRIRYNKYFDLSKTYLNFTGYENSSDFYDFIEASQYCYNDQNSCLATKRKAQLTLSQNMNTLGSMSLTASMQSYWGNKSKKYKSLFFGWSKNIHGITLNINQSISTTTMNDKDDRVLFVGVSLPLGQWLTSRNNLRMSSSASSTNNDYYSSNVSLYGTDFDDRLSWAVSQARVYEPNKKNSDNSSISANWQASDVELNAGLSHYYNDGSLLNFGARGALLLHQYGITLSQQLYENSGYSLIRTPSAKGVALKNHTTIETNSSGYAVIPSLMPYRVNDITIDTATMSDDIDMNNPSQQVIPTREAIVLADFNTRIGYRAYLTVTFKGKTVPFGSTAIYGDYSTFFNEKGQIYVTGLAKQAKIQVVIGASTQCTISFDTRVAKLSNGIYVSSQECK